MSVGFPEPIWVYDNWSAYTDGYGGTGGPLDAIRLTEALALEELDALTRLQRAGARFDYYMMNAFWFEPDSGYRQWRAADWPAGPDRWIEGCRANGLKPGLWFGTNAICRVNGVAKIDLVEPWLDSLDDREFPMGSTSYSFLSFHEGGFLADFIEVLQHWYERGIRLFELDFASFNAATASTRARLSEAEIQERNRAALREALARFRMRNPEARLVAYNDFGGDIESTSGPFPFKKPTDSRWLEVFDALYCGDTRLSDVPMANFWRSVDLYSDHMVRRFEQSGFPLERLDPLGFTLSTTWFGYNRQKSAWRGMLCLAAARGAGKITIFGDLRLLDADDAAWFAKVQSVYALFPRAGQTRTFGAVPGEGSSYGYRSGNDSAAVYTIVNPSQSHETIALPDIPTDSFAEGRVLFRDAGHRPHLNAAGLTLGPEQMAVVAYGKMVDRSFDLGSETDVIIPDWIEKCELDLVETIPNGIEALITLSSSWCPASLRVVIQQRSTDGAVFRSVPDRGRHGVEPKIGSLFTLEASQAGRQIAVQSQQAARNFDLGVSWFVAELVTGSFEPDLPIRVRCVSNEPKDIRLQLDAFIVRNAAEVGQ